MSAAPRIAIITNVLAPYRRELYRRLSNSSRVEVRFFFEGHRTLEPKWQFRSDAGIRGERVPTTFWLGQTSVNLSLLRRLRAFRPQALLCVGAGVAAGMAYWYHKRFSVPLWLWWAGTRLSEQGRSRLQMAWRRFLFPRVNGVVTYSSLATEYARDLAGPKLRVVELGNNTMDATAWRAEVRRLRAEQPRDPTQPVVLGVGQLTARKNYQLVIRAMAGTPAKARLVLLGNGPDRAALAHAAAQCGVANRVEFRGDLPHAEIMRWLARASVFVHPARMDQWAQAINEAMAAELPVVISSTSGVPAEFATPGVNALVHDADDVAGWTASLRRLLSEPDEAVAMGVRAGATAVAHDVQAALRILEDWAVAAAQ